MIQTDTSEFGSQPYVATNNDGAAVVAWAQTPASDSNVWANVYFPDRGWSGPERIDHTNSTSLVGGVTMDREGNAVVVWAETLWPVNNAMAVRYTAGAGWGSPTHLEFDSANNVNQIRVAGNEAGDVVAVWSIGSPGDIWANRFVPGDGWQGPVSIEGDAGNAYSPRVAVDGQGNAVAVWYQLVGGFYNIRSNRYSQGVGWGAPATLDTEDLGTASSPQISAEAGGNMTVVWTQWNGSVDNVWANRYLAGVGWAGAQLIEGYDGEPVVEPRVGTGADGSAVVVWTRNVWGVPYVASVWYTPGIGWSEETFIEVASGDAQYPVVGAADDGTAVVTWQKIAPGNVRDIWACRFVPGQGWGDPTSLDDAISENAVWPAVAVARNGHAWVAWTQGPYNYFEHAAHYTPPDDTAPALALMQPGPGGVQLAVPQVQVAGTTEPGASVSVNGYAAQVLADGSFSLSIPVPAGTSSIRVTATDAAGNMAVATASVTYTDPVPALQAQLASAQANATALQLSLDATRADLAAAQGDVAAAQADVAAAQSALAALEADQNATQASLDEARADLTAAQAGLTQSQTRVTTLEASFTATSASLNATNAQLAATNAQLSATQARLADIEGAANGTRLDLAVLQAQIQASQASLNDTRAQLQAAEARINNTNPDTTGGSTTPVSAGDSNVPLFAALGAMAMGAGGLVIGLRSASAIARSAKDGRLAPPPPKP